MALFASSRLGTRLGRGFILAGLIWLTIAGYGQPGRFYLAKLESKYDPLNLASQPVSTISQIRYVVVLGAGHVSDPRLPVTSQVGGSSLYRLTEGIRIFRRLPGSKLVLTGGPGFDAIPNAEVVAAVAVELGIDRESIVILNDPDDTRAEAVSVKEFVGTVPFVLVTSAVHMPRAMRVFLDEGMRPIPAPTEFVFHRRQKMDPSMLLPTARGLWHNERAMYEFFATLQEVIRGW